LSTRRIAKHLEEDGLREFFQLSEGFATLGQEHLGLVQNHRNPLLLWKWRKQDS
jgi:hypothetical protein